MPISKKNKREEKRKQAAFVLRGQKNVNADKSNDHHPKHDVRKGEASDELLCKRMLSAAEAREYVGFISSNSVAKFGIVKLHCVNLDVIYNTSDLLGDDIRADGSALPSQATLMMIANYKNRDKIMSALIRCGADPSVYPGFKYDSTVHIGLSLNEMYPPYSVWIVKKLYSMLSKETGCYPEGDIHRIECKFCSDSVYPLLVWECGHKICWLCSWKAACRPLLETDHAFRCPLVNCSHRCDGGDDNIRLKIYNDLINDICSDSLCEKWSEKRKQESKIKWAQLPSDLAEYKQSKHSHKSSSREKASLKAQPYHVIACQYLGNTQIQRVEELHKASAKGDIYRLRAIFNAGVDIEQRNEYGQSAVLIACMHAAYNSVVFLLWAGASLDVVDNSGCNPFMAIKHSRHGSDLTKTRILDILEEVGFDAVVPHVIMPDQFCVQQCEVRTLIPVDKEHLGAGAFIVDNCFTEEFLQFIDDKYRNCPVTKPSKPSCSSRSYYCDTCAFFRSAFEIAIRNARLQCNSEHAAHALTSLFPMMRFLCYDSPGGSLPPHEDLSRSDHSVTPPIVSSHTFILYLTSCEDGGETVLLSTAGSDREVLAAVKPKRGRLFLFPHRCPHEGAPVQSVPKVLLRGEAF